MKGKVDLESVIRSKMPRGIRFIPKFVIGRIGRMIRLDNINHLLENYSDLPPLEFIERTLEHVGVTYTVHGAENIPRDKKVVFASNHPLGGLDGLILALAIAPYVPGVKLIVNDLLMNLDPLSPLFVPINKHGSQSHTYAQGVSDLYESDDAIITFPAGLCSRMIDGRIQDPPWKRNFVVKARKSGRIILPVFISGLNSRKFYKLAKLRKNLNIRVNFEMVMLPAEMFDQKGEHIDIYIGEPVFPDTGMSAHMWTEEMRDRAYRLAPKPAGSKEKTIGR